MRALFDVNFIIALLDPDHVHHSAAHDWWSANRKHGWASCPITENGVIRILSNPNYSPGLNLKPGDLIENLRSFTSDSDHDFWPDDISLRNEDLFVAERIHGTRQLTDIYLLALAIENGGRLVTFDESIPLSAVKRAKERHLIVA